MPKKEKRDAEAISQSNDNRIKRVTQEDKVLVHLREHGSITSMQAFRDYSITRLAATIFNLREKGYNIGMVWETSKNGARYGRYILHEEDVA